MCFQQRTDCRLATAILITLLCSSNAHSENLVDSAVRFFVGNDSNTAGFGLDKSAFLAGEQPARQTAGLGCGARASDCHKIVVCIENSQLAAEVDRATVIASEIFTTARVGVEWKHADQRSCPVALDRPTVIISLVTRTPADLRPGALAYALPYEGRHIVVFGDRILSASPELMTPLFAHVIAHEITHILQGTTSHSEEGIMKAHWDHNDFAVMKQRPLRFTETDVQLIRDGLARYGRSGR